MPALPDKNINIFNNMSDSKDRLLKFFRKTNQKLKRLFSDKNFLTLIYKLLHDALFIILFLFTVILIAEGLLPGLASSHLSLTKVAIMLVATLGGIVHIGKIVNQDYPKTRLNESKLLPILIAVSFLMIGNALIRFTLWENIIITISTMLFFVFFYHLLFSDNG